jgi:hypothetical protein
MQRGKDLANLTLQILFPRFNWKNFGKILYRKFITNKGGIYPSNFLQNHQSNCWEYYIKPSNTGCLVENNIICSYKSE